MRASLVAKRLKHLPSMRETWVQSLGQEDMYMYMYNEDVYMYTYNEDMYMYMYNEDMYMYNEDMYMYNKDMYMYMYMYNESPCCAPETL